jgi:hypothetical protein
MNLVVGMVQESVVSGRWLRNMEGSGAFVGMEHESEADKRKSL